MINLYPTAWQCTVTTIPPRIETCVVTNTSISSISSSTPIFVQDAGNVSFLLTILISLMFLMVVGFVYNNMTDKKPWHWYLFTTRCLFSSLSVSGSYFLSSSIWGSNSSRTSSKTSYDHARHNPFGSMGSPCCSFCVHDYQTSFPLQVVSPTLSPLSHVGLRSERQRRAYHERASVRERSKKDGD